MLRTHQQPCCSCSDPLDPKCFARPCQHSLVHSFAEQQSAETNADLYGSGSAEVTHIRRWLLAKRFCLLPLSPFCSPSTATPLPLEWETHVAADTPADQVLKRQILAKMLQLPWVWGGAARLPATGAASVWPWTAPQISHLHKAASV